MAWSQHLRRLARTARQDRRGSIAVAASLILVSVLSMVTLVIDGGIVRVQTARLQAGADAAALAVTWAFGNAAAVTGASLGSNGLTGVTTTLATGMYCADPSIAAASRFTAGASSCPTLPSAGTSANAVQVQLSRTVPLVLGMLSPTRTVQLQATALAVRTDVAGIIIGSTMAQLDGGAVNGLLGGLLGTSVSGSAAGYAGLAGAQVDVLDLLNAFAAQAGVSGGTYGSLANVSLGMSSVAAALVVALGGSNASGSTTAAAAAATALGPELGNIPVRIGALIDLGPWLNDQIGAVPPSALHGALNAYLVMTDAAQSTGGALFSVPSLAVTLPAGIGSASVSAAAILPPTLPFFGFGPAGETVRTSQVRLAVSLVLTAPLLNLFKVTLPLYLQVASGVAQISAISCGTAPATDSTVAVLAQSALADAYVGQVSPADLTSFDVAPTVRSATLVNASGVLTVTGSSHTSLGSSGQQTLTYTQAMIAADQSQSVSSTNLPSSLGQSLGGSNLTLGVTVIGVGLTPSVVTSAVSALLSPILSTTLDPLLASLLATFGIRLGTMDVIVDGVRCGVPALVQ